MTDENTLWIVAETEVAEETVEIEGRRDGGFDTGGGFGPTRSIEAIKTVAKRKRVSLDAQALKSQMQGMLAIVNDLFDQASTANAVLQLNEVELSVEINAEGQLSLVGNGGKLGNTGGITLKFVRPQ
ncbi:MAG: hypothetical protein AAF152_20375 [Cyanobacteria bacterium P01_A01_bin.114]